ncbi:ferritin-like domain-containing protein [Hymenobacter elongatus]|uniref:Ferritin-like domain-containing protein n=1 Tax=Hymenobacter elongatus TaxID=877208 RepID=A0A4Z0PPA9_9BACT|nr:ferritin-like domain-containing protein [Hymenobacter elongatus]TGE19324.1 ferritin-like domain-containing protein [Hymenobacter elongatus]
MTFQDWATYFRQNQHHLDQLSWDDPYRLNDREKRQVRHSLQHFQKGESSEGKHLYQRVKAVGDAEYTAAIRLFIKQEQGHARVLGEYMEGQKIPRLRTHWLDAIFRSLRRWATLEHTIRVLLTAEIIAAVYYKALFQATFSGLLQQICRRIMQAEEMHINFQCFSLRQLERDRSGLLSWTIRLAYRLLLLGTTLLVWLTYHRMLRAGGFGLLAFADAVWDELDRAERMMTGTDSITIRGQQVKAVRPAGPTVCYATAPTFRALWAGE